MLFYHLIELRYRLFYLVCSFAISFFISLFYLPDLLQNSPFVFLNNRWDETLLTLIELAAIIAILSTLPAVFFNIYWFMKPALLADELICFKYALIWLTFVVICCIFFVPLLVFKLPYFLLTFQSDTMMFYPTFNALSSIIVELLLAFVVLGAVPFLVRLNWQRSVLYSIVLILSAIFIDMLTIILVLLPLVTVIELSFFTSILLNKVKRHMHVA